MKQIQASNGHVVPGGLLVALLGVALAGAALADLMVTNAAGVRAGITGIVTVPPNTVNVQWVVLDPTGTNVTRFFFQQSDDLKTWTNFNQTVIIVTGSFTGVIADLTTPTSQFYRMRLINFQ
jgi:hypothetical protein